MSIVLMIGSGLTSLTCSYLLLKTQSSINSIRNGSLTAATFTDEALNSSNNPASMGIAAIAPASFASIGIITKISAAILLGLGTLFLGLGIGLLTLAASSVIGISQAPLISLGAGLIAIAIPLRRCSFLIKRIRLSSEFWEKI